MSESNAVNANGPFEVPSSFQSMVPREVHAENGHASSQDIQIAKLRLDSPPQDVPTRSQADEKQKPIASNGGPSSPWLRAFLSLRTQLMIGYGILFILSVLLLLMLFMQHLATPLLGLVALAIIVFGLIIAFGITTFLLRPLQQTIDAAQAIALGDLKQRKRLPLRLPPQDEIDRLAGSLDEMATRLEHAEEAQYRSEQSFRRFFSDASHQLRTPLTSLRGFTEILLRGVNKDDPEAMQRVLQRMRSEAERMTRLINDLLTLARLDDTRALKIQYTDLVELGQERIEQAKLLANDSRTITLVVNTEGGLAVQADRERLKHLLFLLLDNALKYGRPAPDGIITLELERRNEEAIIRVIDNGEGIVEEELKHIFDAFYRGSHRHAVISNTGSGLGLAIASSIVRVHNGSITATSKPEEGTTFTVVLPSAC